MHESNPDGKMECIFLNPLEAVTNKTIWEEKTFIFTLNICVL